MRHQKVSELFLVEVILMHFCHSNALYITLLFKKGYYTVHHSLQVSVFNSQTVEKGRKRTMRYCRARQTDSMVPWM